MVYILLFSDFNTHFWPILPLLEAIKRVWVPTAGLDVVLDSSKPQAPQQVSTHQPLVVPSHGHLVHLVEHRSIFLARTSQIIAGGQVLSAAGSQLLH